MTPRVLLIASDVPGMELMCHLLTTYGYVPLRARNGAEGLRLAAHERPDLIVYDIPMPLDEGYEVARRIRADPVLNGTPMIAVGEFAIPEERRDALAAGFDGYLSKPISAQSFLRHIEAFLVPVFRAAAAAAKSPVPETPTPRSGGLKVMVVDDTAANLMLASSLLGGAGYQVVTATGMSEALRMARKDPPDLILSDIVMTD